MSDVRGMEDTMVGALAKIFSAQYPHEKPKHSLRAPRIKKNNFV